MRAEEFRQVIDRVRSQTDLPALIGEQIQLEQSGSVLKGRSPWNADSTPSFVVWPASQTWRDFSGGGSLGGDCFDWVKQRDGLDFMGALRLLAARAGLALPGADSPEAAAELARLSERRQVSALLTAAAAYYHHVLPSKIRKAWYRDHYGFTDATIDDLLLGWADGHLFEHMTGLLGTSREEALATGLFVQLADGRVEDFFRDRLVFPYWSRGKVVYFIARATEHTGTEPWEQAKYKKLLTRSDRHAYVSRCVANDTIFNEDAARGAEEVLITEGVTDCISAMQAGLAAISPVTVRFRHQDHPKLLDLTANARRVVVCNDTEDSGAGEAGALETAKALYAAGRDVRLASISLPEGKTKIDVNELVKEQGAHALKAVVRQAKRLPEFLLSRIPADTPHIDLGRDLQPILRMLKDAPALEREACSELIALRFKVRRPVLRELFRELDQKEATPAIQRSHKGQVHEASDHYFLQSREGELAVSTFHIEPKQRVRVEDGEVIIGDVTARNGKTFTGMSFPLEAFRSRKSFLRTLMSADFQWFGSDENVQSVLALIASRDLAPCRGTTNLGYLATADGPRWVTAAGVLSPLGHTGSYEELRYVPSGASLDQRVSFKAVSMEHERELAGRVLPALLNLNRPEVLLPILGWFFATPLKPRIQKALGHFPILMVWGTQGSGKSSLVMEVFWPLFGIISAEPFSATETEFALLKLLSATNSVPVFIDEYKPFDMPKPRRNSLHRLMRRLYTGETEERGRADQTLVTYRLEAPLCLAGETRPIEPALVERILTANPAKDELLRNPQFSAAFDALRREPLNELSAGIIRFLLARDTAANLQLAKKVTSGLLIGREVPPRVRDNLTVMVLGLHHLEEYAEHLGIKLPDLDVAAAIAAIGADLLESNGTAVKTGLDLFLEELSVMAVTGGIQHGREYVFNEGRLALHFPSCHAAFAEHCRRIGFEGEVPDRKSLKRQLEEAKRRGSYVLDVDAVVTFSSRQDRRRSVLIDVDQVRAALSVDDFPAGPIALSSAASKPYSPSDPDRSTPETT
jgi:DNA primase catalytic core